METVVDSTRRPLLQAQRGLCRAGASRLHEASGLFELACCPKGRVRALELRGGAADDAKPRPVSAVSIGRRARPTPPPIHPIRRAVDRDARPRPPLSEHSI